MMFYDMQRPVFSWKCSAWLALIVAWLGLFPVLLYAVTPLDAVDVSPDITVDLSGQTVNDEEVATDDLAGIVTVLNIGMPPTSTDVQAYHLLDDGQQLFVLATTVTLSGPLTVGPADVVRFDGTTFSLAFNGAANGVPNGVHIDAVSTIDDNLLLSFDTTVALGAFTAADEDLVRFDGFTFSLFFDGSAAGVPSALDLNAAHHLAATGHLLLSFDGSGTVDSVTFDDEDVLEYDPIATTWELAYDGSAQHVAWPVADLDAVHALATPIPCDIDNNTDVDIADVQLILAARNQPALPDDPRDIDGDGVITVLDARQCVLACTNPRCAPS